MFANRTDWPLHENEITKTLARLKANGYPIIDLTRSNPTECGFDYLEPHLLTPLTCKQSLCYEPDPKGILNARKAIAAYYKDRHQTHIDTDRIFITSSTSEAYSFIFKLLLNPNETLFTPKPSYPLLEFLCNLHDIDQKHYSLRRDQNWSVDFQSFGHLSRNPKAISVIHPNNPTGSFISLPDQAELTRFAKKNSLALISDEVFLDYQLNPQAQHASTFALNQETLTFTLSGISKVLGLPQMKLSWIVVSGPSELVDDACQRLEVIADTFLTASTPSQLALSEWMKALPKIQKEICIRLNQNLTILKSNSDQKTRIHSFPVAGGWCGIIEIPGVNHDQDFCLHLLEAEQVLIQPGYWYDFDRENFFVLSLLTHPTHFEEGVRKLVRFANTCLK